MTDPVLGIVETVKIAFLIEPIGEVLVGLLGGLSLVPLGDDALNSRGHRIIGIGGAYGDIVRLGEEGETYLAGGGEGRVLVVERKLNERLAREENLSFDLVTLNVPDGSWITPRRMTTR